MDLIFTHIYEAARSEMGLTRDEYALCNYISVWSAHPASARPGWCNRTLKQKAKWIGVTERGLTKMQNRMIKLNLVEKDSITAHTRTTVAWFDMVNRAKSKEQSSLSGEEQSSVDQGTKFRRHREQSSVGIGNKVPPHSNVPLLILDNDFEVIEGAEKVSASPVEVVIEFLNQTLKPVRPYSPKTKKTVESINARLKEKYTVDDICLVIEFKTQEWSGNPKMEPYLRPETLFGTQKFEGYLIAASNWQAKGKPKNKNGHGTNGINSAAPDIASDATVGAFSDY